MRRFALIGFMMCLFAGAIFYLHLVGRFALLYRSRNWNVVVNGVIVEGEVMAGRTSGMVTRRDRGKEHSYLLFYEGDVDQTGDMGRAIDCRKWIAPRLPILIQTDTYPNCKARPHDNANPFRMSLGKDGASQFVTTDGDVISIRKR